MLDDANHHLSCVALGAFLGACTPNDHAPVRQQEPAPAAVASASSAPRADASRSSRVVAAGEPFLFHSWSFDPATTSFGIVDLAMHGSLTDALGPHGRIAFNAGFFDPDGRPLGFSVSDGKVLSKYSATMSGGVFFVTDGVAHIEATEDFDAGPVAFAVQCRPRLVVHGQANVKGDDGQRAERTALCVRDGGRTVDVVVAEPALGTRGPSLYALGQYLANERHCDDALNLDGGPSTGVAYRQDDGGAARSIAPRGPLRYAVVLR